MDDNELLYARGVLLRLAGAARSDRALARTVRDLILQTSILQVFGVDEVDVTALLEAGGVPLVRAWLGELTLADLKRVVETNGYDPERTSVRWRSPGRFIDLIVTRALERWEELDRVHLDRERERTAVATGAEQPRTPSGADWML